MSDELYHYGIKGMKWGVRRTAKELGYKSNRDVKKLAKNHASLQEDVAMVRSLKAAKARGIKVNDYDLAMANTRAVQSAKFSNKLVKRLNEKYESVDLLPGYDIDGGEQYITAILKDKLGNTYMHEIYTANKAVGDYVIPDTQRMHMRR